MLETKLLSKVLLEKDFYALSRFNVTAMDFKQHADIYKYIKEFVAEYDETPDFKIVMERFSTFDFQTEVFDSFTYLCKALKKHNAKVKIYHILQNQAGEKFKSDDIDDFITWLHEEVDAVKRVSSASSSFGTNYAANGADRWARYQETKAKEGSGVFIPTPYFGLNKALDGGMELGDYVLLQAFSNKGKSWIASDIGRFAWRSNFGVLHYSPELSKSQQENRLDTLDGHFNNVAIRNGNLTNEEKFKKYLDGFKEGDNPYIIKTMEDLPGGLSLDVIENDLKMNDNVKLVIIDGFNLMNHGKGDRTAMTTTSRKLRQIFGRYNVVGLVVHQVSASEERENRKGGEDGERLPKPASILGYSETLAVVQDAAHIFSYDYVDGLGAIQLVKTRATGVDEIINLNVNYNMGYIQEASPVDHF
ncbi:DNA helicase [Bacillus wiedmannii]|nr:DNA helicase [Bacillus wiedmannii]